MFKQLAVVTGFVFSLMLGNAVGEDGTRRSEILNDFSRQIENAISQDLDFRSGGGGTGRLARDLRAIANDFGQSRLVAATDELQKELPVTVAELRQHVLEMNGGYPAQVVVYDYERAVNFANVRLKRAGFDFVEAVQAPEAKLVEAVRDFIAIAPRKKDRTIAELKDLELAVMGRRGDSSALERLSHRDLSGAQSEDVVRTVMSAMQERAKSHTIYVAMDDEELVAANAALRRKVPPRKFTYQDGTVHEVSWTLAKDPSMDAREPLPETSVLIGDDARRYARWEGVRLPVMMGLAVLGSTLPVAFSSELQNSLVTYLPAISSWTALAASVGFATRANADGSRKKFSEVYKLPLFAAVLAAGATIPTGVLHWDGLKLFLPALAGGSTAAALEWQFTRFSHRWAYFWDRGGILGNILVNILYPTIVSAVMMATESGLQMPISLNTNEFLVKTMFVGTAAFVGSFGLMQIRAARDQAQGEFSNFSRFRLETASCFWNGFGRIVALTAAGFGVKYGLGEFMGASFGLGEAIGWGIQAAYFTALTAPMWAKSFFGRKAYDAKTRAIFEGAKGGIISRAWSGVKYGCNTVLGALGNLYTFDRTPKPIPVLAQ